MTTSASAANLFWVGASGTTNAPTAGNWVTTTPTVWSDGTVNTADAGWTAGSAAIFGGTDPQTVPVTVGGAISASSLTFNHSGFSFSASSAETITTTASPFLVAASGTSNIIGSNVKVNTSVSAALGSATGGGNGGNIVVASGGSLTSSKAMTIQGSGTVVNVQGGTLSTANATSAFLSIGSATGDNAALLVNGGSVSVLKNTGSIWICPGPAAVSGASGTLTITNGGTVTETGGFVSVGQGSGDVGTLNLDGGTLTTANINGGGGTGQSGLGSSTVNFNGGILKTQSTPSPTAFFTGVTSANVRNGGAVVNNNGFAIIFAQPLLHSSIPGDNATDGGLTSLGTGTLTFTGANTYNGPTLAVAGALVVTSDSTGGGAFTVADGASLEVQVNNFGTSLTNSSLTFGTTGNLTNTFTLNGNASATVPAVQVNGALNLNGMVRVNVNGSLSGPSTNLLISYHSISGSGSFVAGTLPSVPGYTALLVNNTTNKTLTLVYLPPSVPVQWAVTSGSWDTTSFNWEPLGGGALTNYYELSPVTFDDTAPYAATHTVTLTANHTPTDININSSNDYVLTGSFAITAGGALNKSGNGTLTLAVNSAYSGGTTINAGTVQVGNGGTTGSVGTGDITDNGALVFDRSDSLSIAGVISGSGSLIQNGGGILNLTATNNYSGPTAVNAGKLVVLTANTGNGDYTVADGATLDVQASAPDSDLQVNSLTLGTSGLLTNNFDLGNARSTVIPQVYDTGALNLNGTVTVNVTGSGLLAGTYILLDYAGSVTGSGSFVPGNLPGISTITNDTVNQQLDLIVNTPGLVWDSGDTTNGGIIDPASGTWDLTTTNLVWNNAGVNVAYANGNNAIFAGADGNYGIKIGAAVSPPIVAFLNSGYTLTNDAPQTITLGNTSTGVPKLVVAAGKTATIGTNVIVSTSSTSFFGNAGNTPGGTLIIGAGGVFQETTGNSFVLDGAGTVLSVQTGGLFQHAGGGSGQLAIGAGNSGGGPTLSVDGGSVVITANNCALNVGTGMAGVAGVLTLNGGSLSMPAGTIMPLNLGVQTGDIGTANLNGGTLNVAQIVKGNVGAIATNNFNGGTLKAINATFAASFMNGLDCANVRNGGAIIDDGGFAITVGQNLQHSVIAGDSAVDGGLTKLGAGTLALTGANTYTGITTVSNGTLQINGSTLGNTVVGTNAILAGTGTNGGAVTVSAGGILAPGVGDTSTLTINGNLTLQGNLAAVVNESISPSNNLCNVNGTASSTGTGFVTVTNMGPTPAIGDSFKLFTKPLTGGSTLAITPAPGSGLAWTNKLAIDGSIAVVSAPTIASYPTNITAKIVNNQIILTWPATHLGWIAQSNSVSLISPNSWFDIPGSDSVTGLTNNINLAETNVFYRLRHP